jgi:phage host-nuclease inhibitor protein Gam
MSKNRIKKTAAAVPTPRTKADMEILVAQIAGMKRAEADLKLRLDERIAAIKELFDEELATVAAQLEPLKVAAESWATSNPEAFGKNKSIKFLQGTVGFRTTTPKLEPLNKKWTWALITSAVERMLPNFIRSKPEVDREGILGQRDELAEFLPLVGLKVSQSESFFVDVETTPVATREVVGA